MTFESGDTVNNLVEEALAYEYFIENVNWVSPEIDMEEATVSYNREESCFYIGPVTFEYTRWYVNTAYDSIIAEKENTDGRLDMAGIMNISVKLDNDKTIILTPSHFVYQNARTDAAKKDIADGYKYPQPYEKCYIKLSYEECLGATKMLDFDIKMQRFAHSVGRVITYNSKYYKFTATATCETDKVNCPYNGNHGYWCKPNKESVDEEGNPITVCKCDEKKTEKHWISRECPFGEDSDHKLEVTVDKVEFDISDPLDAQELLYFEGAGADAIVYKEVFTGGFDPPELPEKGWITLKKIVNTEKDKALPENAKNQKFKYKMTIMYTNEDGERVATPDSPIEFELSHDEEYQYYMEWDSLVEPPTYSIEEVDIPEGYTLQGFSDSPSGTFEDGENIPIICENYYDPESFEVTLNLSKEFEMPEGAVESDKEKLENFKFKFYIYERDENHRDSLIDTIELGNGETYTKEFNSLGKIVIKEDLLEIQKLQLEGTVFLDEFLYDDTPIDKDEIIINFESNGEVKNVIAKNIYDDVPTRSYGNLKILKDIEGTDITDDMKNKEFQFKITSASAEGEGSYKEIVSSVNNPYSETFKWYSNELAPQVKIEEINIPDGYEWSSTTVEYVSVDENGNETRTPAEPDALGYYSLENGLTLEVKVENIAPEFDHFGNLNLKKIVTGDNIDPNQKFKFTVNIYKSSGMETYPVLLAKDEEWNKKVVWNDGEPIPQFEIIEDVPAGYSLKKFTISEEGKNDKKVTENYLKESFSEGKTINVTCENIKKISLDQVYLRIYKEISPENLSTVEFERAKDIKFKFNIYKVDLTTGEENLYKEGIQISANEPYEEIFTIDDSNPEYKFIIKEDLSSLSPLWGFEKFKENTSSVNEIIVILNTSNKDVTVTAINQYDPPNPVSGTLIITKKLIGNNITENDKDKYFTFEIIDENGKSNTVQASVNSPYIKDYPWSGQSPKFQVREINIPSGFEQAGPISVSLDGVEVAASDMYQLSANSELTFTASNKKDTDKFGYLTLKKVVKGDTSSNPTFAFRVKITDSYGNIKEDTYTLNAGGSENIEVDWSGPQTPTYEIEETNMSTGFKFEKVEVDRVTYYDKKISGEFKKNSVVNVIYTNKDEDFDKAKLRIEKSVSGKDSSASDSFKFIVTVDGVSETVYVSQNSPWEKEYDLKPGEKLKYTVVEELEGESKYRLSDFEGDSGILEQGKTCIARFHNVIDDSLLLVTQIGGTVWEDEYSNGKPSILNGLKDSGEIGIPKVQVIIWKVDGGKREAATVYDDNMKETSNVLFTDENGNWTAYVPAPGEGSTVGYDVEFVYDGQTYETTTFLSQYDESTNTYVEGNASSYIGASTAERTSYANRSMAKETKSARTAFDKSFAEIYGKTPINAQNGKTQGTAEGSNGSTKSLDYVSTDYKLIGTLDENNTRKQSTLITKNDEGYVLDQYALSVKTSDSGLTFELDSKYHINGYDKVVKINGTEYNYIATYNYMQNINLGLVKRKPADLGVIKDLDSANVVVNERLLTYRFNNVVNLMGSSGTELLHQQIKINEANITYSLNLYKSDYFYRASMYKANQDQFNYDKISTVKTLDTEMEVYLKYKITVKNESSIYKATINELIDYYDNRLTIVEATAENPDGETRVVKNYNGDEFETGVEKVVGEKSTYEVLDSGGNVTSSKDTIWAQRGTVSDGTTTFNESYTNSLKGEVLAPGESITVYVTYRVNRDYVYKANAANEIENSIQLGEMHNIAEIGNYSTYYEDGSIAGKIDKDSAPDNANIAQRNDVTWFEDDTDKAPSITISLYDEQRSIDGMVWEDIESDYVQDGYGQIIANGILDENEKGIDGVTVQLVEKIVVDGLEYEYIWPETYEYNGTTIDLLALSGLSSTTLSGQYNIEEVGDGTFRKRTDMDTNKYNIGAGNYKFIGVPAGNFVIRFIYGDNEDIINSGINGQDYKSTIYQRGINENIDTSGYLVNEWHDLTSTAVSGLDSSGNVVMRLSDARDLELRRMQVVAYSKTMTNENASVLESADEHETKVNADGTTNHTELIKNTQMVAETAKINVDVESVFNTEVLPGVDTNTISGTTYLNGQKTEIARHEYRIGNIDFGLEERSSTVLKLKKEISKITLTTVDGIILVEANYTKDEYGQMVATGTGIEHIQSLNSIRNDEGAHKNTILSQGFRYINIDENLMQGATIKIEYDIVVENLGEIDRVGALRNYNTKEEILSKVNELTDRYNSSLNKDFGLYLGTIYYTGLGDSDAVVTTKIEKIIDYVDNNAVFSAEQNTGIENHSWQTITTQELMDGKLLEPSEMTMEEYEAWLNLTEAEQEKTATTYVTEVIDETKEYYIVDMDGVRYETEQKNNLIINVNDFSVNPSLVVNLVPQGAVNEDGEYVSPDTEVYGHTARIGLTTTKYLSPENDTGDITFENIAEIIQFTNIVGRRDTEAVVGNSKPSLGETVAANQERDTDATEVITLTPPTGLSMIQRITREVTETSFAGLIIALICVSTLIIIIQIKTRSKVKRERKVKKG